MTTCPKCAAGRCCEHGRCPDCEFIRVNAGDDGHSHWPTPGTYDAVCGRSSPAVLFVFRRDRVTCEGCAAWLAEHPFVTTWDVEIA